MEAKADAEAMEDTACLLAYSDCFIVSRTTSLRVVPSGLAHIKKLHHSLPTSQSSGAILQIEVPSSYDSGLYKVHIKLAAQSDSRETHH